MALYPKIQSPCPYTGPLSAIMDGDMCRLCKREVFDLGDMGDEERVAFLKRCTGEVCVSYKYVRPALAAAAIAAMAIATPAAAQDATDAGYVVLVGGIKNLANVEFMGDPVSIVAPESPVSGADSTGRSS